MIKWLVGERVQQMEWYSRTIRGNLKIRIMVVQACYLVMIILLALGYFNYAADQEEQELERLNAKELIFKENRDRMEQVLNGLHEEGIRKLETVDRLLNLNMTNESSPCVQENRTLCGQVVQGYTVEQTTMVYEVTKPLNQDGWQRVMHTTNAVTPFILNLMNHYDNYQIFEQIGIVNTEDAVIHRFPIGIIMNTPLLLQEQPQGFSIPLSQGQGYIYGKLNQKRIEMILDGLKRNYYRIQTQDFSLQNQYPKDDRCELMQQCQHYFQANITSIFTLVMYQSNPITQEPFFQVITLQWPFFTIFALFALLSILLTNHSLNHFTRDITNPIKQITLKLDKIIQNVFQPKIFDKIQADDILIKEATEVQQLATQFTDLFNRLKEADVFSHEIVGSIDQSYSKPKEILIKQQDKSIDQIRQIIQRYAKEL